MANKISQALYSHFHGNDATIKPREKADTDKNTVERFFVVKMAVYPGETSRLSSTQNETQSIGIPRMQYMILPRSEYPIPHPLTFNSKEVAKNWIIRKEGGYNQ